MRQQPALSGPCAVSGSSAAVATGRRCRAYGHLITKVLLADRDFRREHVAAGLASREKVYEEEQDPENRTRYTATEIDTKRVNADLYLRSRHSPQRRYSDLRSLAMGKHLIKSTQFAYLVTTTIRHCFGNHRYQ